MDKDELRAWLRLSMTDGVGNDTARRLLACFGSPQAVFEQTEAALCQVATPKQAQALLSVPNELAVQCVRTHQWLMHQPNTHSHAVWTLGDTQYPSELLQLADPPLLIYVAGQTHANLGNAVAIVGSRNPTPQGAQTAEQFGEALSAAGLCVVSGLALGVDGAAHKGALRGGKIRDEASPSKRHWRTVAVVGTGLDRVYPRQHQTLAHDIALHGLIISEYLLGTAPLAHNFPKRNRIIAALGLGTLVVKAALKSGSLITAKMALDLNREVLAIPGSIHATQSHGCHALIRQGAKLVENAQDVLEELQLAPQQQVNLFGDALDQCWRRRTFTQPNRTSPARPHGLCARQPRCAASPLRLRHAQLASAIAHARTGWRSGPFTRGLVSALSHDLRWNNDIHQKIRHKTMYIGFMFEVLVFVYENYWRGDACPELEQLGRKLSAAGFEVDDIQQALSWLDELNLASHKTELIDISQSVREHHTESAHSMRVYSVAEQDHLGAACLGFINFLESADVLSPHMREIVLDRAMAIPGHPMDLNDLKIIVLMVYWSIGLEPDALVLDELCEGTTRVAH